MGKFNSFFFLTGILSLLIFMTAPMDSYAQAWLKNLSDQELDLDDIKTVKQFKSIQKSFNEFWELRDIEKSSGYKQFKRWEWMMEPRVANDVNRNNILWTEFLSSAKKTTEGNWIQLGPKSPPVSIGTSNPVGSGRIDCIAFHPDDPDIFWIGSPTGGLWKTINGGTSWETLTDNLPSIGISDIAVHPGNPDIIYIATGDRDAGELYSAGVLRTSDGGLTWTPTVLSFDQDELVYVYRLLIRPDKPDTLIAGTNEGIYLLNNDGTQKTKVLNNYRIKDMEFKPSDPDVIYAASYSYGNATVFRSTNGGLSFSPGFGTIANTNIRRIELAVSPNNPDLVYALCADVADSKFQGLYYSMNSGVDWQSVANSSKNLLGRSLDGSDDAGQGWYDLALAISPLNQNEVYVGGINIWRTLDGGHQWTIMSSGSNQASNYVHVDQHILEYHPISGDLFSGNDGGIYKSSNQGISWTDLSSDLEILQIYRMGISKQYSNLMLMGSQDNSSILADNTNYQVVKGGDGMECIIDPEDPNILYASSQYGNIGISYDGGNNFASIRPDKDEKGAWVTPYIMHPEKNNILYAGYTNLYRSGDMGKHWTNLGTNLANNDKYISLAIAPSNPDIILVANRYKIWKTIDRGISWTEITNGLPPLPPGIITYIAIAEYNPNKIWLSISNYTKEEKVYTSEDGGSTWTNYSSGLPNVPANCIVIEKGSKSGLYMGTDMGVYYRNRDMDEWINFSSGLPVVIVNELEIFYPDAKIRAGTYGRGLWESELYSPVTPVLFADFEADRQLACIEGKVQLVSHSTINSDSLQWVLQDTINTIFSPNKDTVKLHFQSAGLKDIGLIVFKDGLSDTLVRHGFIEIKTSMDISIIPGLEELGGYIWKGDSIQIEALGGDNYIWTPAIGLNQFIGAIVKARVDSNISYKVTAQDGQCMDVDSVQLIVHIYDSIKNAIPLNYEENGPFINYSASVEENEPHPPLGDCNTQTDWCDEFGTGENVLGNSVWFTFQGPASGVVSIDSRGFDNQIALYDALSPEHILSGNYSILAANDDYYGTEENFAASIRNVGNLVEGQTYWVQVDGSGGNTEGTFYLTLNDFPLAKPSLFDTKTSYEFKIFPNPNPGSFTIQIESEVEEAISIEVISLHGQLLYSRALTLQRGKQNIPMYLGKISSGIYLVKITTPSLTSIQKVIIE